MSGYGWVLLHRKVLDHPFWAEDREPASRFEAWVYFLMRANFQATRVLIGNEFVDIERGSFITSNRKLQEELGWGKERVEGFLKLLAKDQMILVKPTRQYTHISIVNYDGYQLLDHAHPHTNPHTNGTRPAHQPTHQPTTDKERKQRTKKENKEKEALTKFGKFIQMTAEDMGKLRASFPVDVIKREIPRADEWIERSGKPSAKTYQRPNHNHYLFFKQWLERNMASAQGTMFSKPAQADPHANRPKPPEFVPPPPKPERTPEERARIRQMLAEKFPKVRGIE